MHTTHNPNEPDDVVSECCHLTPQMRWSQTSTHVSVSVDVRDVATEPDVQCTEDAFWFEVHSDTVKYVVDTQWYASIHGEKSVWKRMTNGQFLVTIEKQTDAEWSHPFANKAYKGFTGIDWTRWTDCCDSDTEDDADAEPPYDFSSLQQAVPSDVGGNEQNLLNEDNVDFQKMIQGLERLGTDTDIKLPSLDEVKDNMSRDDIADLLKTCDEEGCSEVNLEKVQVEVAIADDDDDAEDDAETVHLEKVQVEVAIADDDGDGDDDHPTKEDDCC